MPLRAAALRATRRYADMMLRRCCLTPPMPLIRLRCHAMRQHYAASAMPAALVDIFAVFPCCFAARLRFFY